MKKLILTILAVLGVGGAGIFGAGFYNRTSNSVTTIGSVTAKTVTTTLTAAEVCSSNVITVTAVTSTPTITLPVTTTLFADCLGVDGNTRRFTVINLSAATSTIMAVGGGGTLGFTSSATIAAAKYAVIEITRYNSSAYLANLINIAN